MKKTKSSKKIVLKITMSMTGTNQFVLNSMSHHMTAFSSNVQMVLLDHSNQLCNNGLLGPRSAVLLIRRTL